MASSRPLPNTQSPSQYSTQSPGTVLNNGQTVRSRSDRSAPVDALESGWGLAVVIAAFLVHCIVDGVGYSFAVFYVDLLGEFSSQGHAKVVLVGTLLPATCLFVGQSRMDTLSVLLSARHTATAAAWGQLPPNLCFAVPEIIGVAKNWTVPGYAHAPSSPKFLMGFCSDRPCECSG